MFIKTHLVSLFALGQVVGTIAKTVSYDWEITWVNAAPDGFERPVIGINGQWPCPTIEASVGDYIKVNMKNSLGNQTTGLHFHGINQINTNYFDGASMVNQCPVPPGQSLTYTFIADVPGTYWYHSHNMGQYPDGFRGPLIIHDPNDPYHGHYDEEVILTISDWYHSQTIPLVQAMLSPNNTQFRPPIPDNIIVNEGQTSNIQFDIGKTYRVRILNFAALGSAMLHFDSHTMSVIQIDASYVQKQEVYQLRIAPAERYDVLISGIDRDQGRNYPFLVSLDINKDFQVNPQWPHNVTGYLITDSKLAIDSVDVVDVWLPFDDAHFVPYDNQPALGPVTKYWELDFDFGLDANGYPRAFFNGKTYITQNVPTLYTAATVENNTNPAIYGEVLPFFAEYGDIVQIVINNVDSAIHPFHLHGHTFQVLDRPQSGAGKWSGSDGGANLTPPKRDVISVNGNSFAVLRFVANNPGIFLFHCHIEWHVEMGLTATLIEAPEKLKNYPIPRDMLDSCSAQGIPTAGNAVGNTDNPSDTTGFITTPPTSYYGATWPAPGTTQKRRERQVRSKSSQSSPREIW
ncbi:Cupredoxin [Pseudomassariella vexata]|uniref:Cupredoxin n=1 Tax=Pseudomassariella vexata TaxID=1141098 RepID=A0A1Y2E156_9PEZI|nr:Cupredoxin [Pseudomassariella vexata]ORY65291.1 Cupredoxin [Pseudomassariella vexata]